MAGGQVVWCSIKRSLVFNIEGKKSFRFGKKFHVVILVQDFSSYKTPGGVAPEAGARFGSYDQGTKRARGVYCIGGP